MQYVILLNIQKNHTRRLSMQIFFVIVRRWFAVRRLHRLSSNRFRWCIRPWKLCRRVSTSMIRKRSIGLFARWSVCGWTDFDWRCGRRGFFEWFYHAARFRGNDAHYAKSQNVASGFRSQTHSFCRARIVYIHFPTSASDGIIVAVAFFAVVQIELVLTPFPDVSLHIV